MKILICLLVALSFNINSRLIKVQYDPFKKYPVKTFLPIDSITSVEIYNAWTSKKWTLSSKGLHELKNILYKSTALKTLILKPGHLYMTIKFKKPDTFKSYNVYMYDTGIFFDSDYLSKKPPYSVELKQKINWDNLK